MNKAQQPDWVTAVFQNAAVSMKFARKMTLAQLAEQLSALGEIYGKLLLPVQVRIAAPEAGRQRAKSAVVVPG